MAVDFTIVRVPNLPPLEDVTSVIADDDEFILWRAIDDTTYSVKRSTISASFATSGVQVPISFTTIVNQTYQGNTAGANYVAALAGLVAGAVIDQVTVDSAILSPIPDFVTQGVKAVTFIAPTLVVGQKVVIFWHLP